MKIWTFQLELVPDGAIPQFKRLVYRQSDIALVDIFQSGIHPHSTFLGDDASNNTGAPEILQGKLNADAAYVPSLKAYHIGHEIAVAHGGYYGRSSDSVEWLLQYLAKEVYFVDDLSYEQLIEIAIGQLRKKWKHEIAKDMITAVGRDFAGIRDFLKRKDPNLVLIGYDSLAACDLSQIVSVDDFLTEESLLISTGIDLHNFRRADSLSAFTDEQGRLRLVPTIKRCVVKWDREPNNINPLLTYHCTVSGNQVRWQPEVKPNTEQRKAAKQLAKAIGRGTGRYCFTSTIADMEKTAKDSRFSLHFPGLNYKEAQAVTEATAKLKVESIICYGENSRLRATDSNEHLKDVLRSFGKSVTGRKDELVKRVVELLVEQYEAKEKELNDFFSQHRFVRIGAQPREMQHFPVLSDYKLRKALVTLYCLRHMRGNVILEARHINQSIRLVDLAAAFLHGQVTVSGSFVPIV